MQDAIEKFLTDFLTPQSTTQQPLIDRARHWLAVAKSPETYHPDADLFELAHRRRNARQNLRRLLNKHPELIAALQTEVTA